MFHLFTQLVVLLSLLIFPVAADGTSVPTLPIVDLGYELHQAYSFDVSERLQFAVPYHCCRSNHSLYKPEAGLYNFSNIRYAEPPVGELRFRASVPPRNNRTSKIIIDQGKIGRICPQGSPGWGAAVVEFLPDYLARKTINASAIDSVLANSLNSPPPPPSQDPRVSEDCLFLDIIVPQKVFEQAAPHRKPLAPVLVWIHGGAYTLGEKTGSGDYNPAGLINTSQSSNSAGLVYVAINYRVSPLHLNMPSQCSLTYLLCLHSLVHLDGFRAPICKLRELPMPVSTTSG